MNMLFNNYDEIKIRICDRNIHKAVQITVGIYQRNKELFVTVQPKSAYKLEFIDRLQLPFLDQPQSDIVVFAIITCHIYNIIVTKWKHGIVSNDIISLNEELLIISTSII